MRRVLAVLVAIALSACGDGGPGSPADQVADASRRLGEVRTADLILRMEAALVEGDGSVGFALEGPFAVPAPGRLPTARLTYTRIAGTGRTTATFVSDGDAAFVETEGGERTPLSRAEVAALRAPADDEPGDEAPDGALGTLALHEWITEPRRVGETSAGGVEVNRIEGGVDVPRALADLAALATGLGAADAPVPSLDGDDRRRLEAAVEDARMVLLVGRDDGIPRRLDVEIDLAAGGAPALREALGSLGGVRLTVHLALDEVNDS